MPSTHVVRVTPIKRTARVKQMEGLFEVSPAKESRLEWSVDLPHEEREWSIGLIVGPSGSGKTTVAREVFGDHIIGDFDWHEDKAVVDGFPPSMSTKDVASLLSSVGFSSPPSWLRPFAALSNGEQFRVTLARALADAAHLVVVDEFTSVVDRTVAQIGSAAVAKAVRRDKKRFVAVSCHYDVLDWLQPDWVYEPATNTFEWRCLQRRPDVKMEVIPAHRSAWDIFRRHHYLSHSLSPAAQCYVGLVDGEPAAFTGVISFPHPRRPGFREHRTVCLPDFQGVGIGNRMSNLVAGAWRARGKPYFSTTSAPGMIYHRAKSPLWNMIRKPSRTSTNTGIRGMNRTVANKRMTASFEYVGPVLKEEARLLGVIR